MATEAPISERTITILSPVATAEAVERPLAARPATLDGVAVAFVDNGKHNFDHFLAEVERQLGERYRFAAIVHKRKPTAVQPAVFLDELAERCQVVVNGLGD